MRRFVNGAKGETRPPRYGLLLLVLVCSYLLSAFATGFWVSAIQLALFVVVAALALRTGHVQRSIARLAIIVVAGGSAVMLTLVLTDHTADVDGAADAWKAVMLAFAVVLIVRRVIALPEVTIQSIYGAVSAYMIIGLMFAACYGAMDRLGGSGFFANGQPDNVQTFQYFSFATLTTVGYGDFTAVHSAGRALAVMEAMVGQIFLATLVARLVSAFRGPARSAEDLEAPDKQTPAANARRRAIANPGRPVRSPAHAIRRRRRNHLTG